MSAATIPMACDVAKLIGSAAQHVENRSLLLDKFVFHKRWPVVEEQTRWGHDFVKWDEASRWSFMRIADGADQILAREAAEKRRKAERRNINPENRIRYHSEAAIAESLASVKWDSKELQALCARHTRHLLGLFRKAYGDRVVITIGQLESRLAINLADSLIQNAGICLDRLFGLPYIPGSAIKGACRHAALEELKTVQGTEREILFQTFYAVFGCADSDFSKGDLRPFRQLLGGRSENQKGAISFLHAYPVSNAEVVVDLTNVHYSSYYKTARTEDLSDENPRPNYFPAVKAGAQFVFFLVLNSTNVDPKLLSTTRRWLETALTILGLGAKTSAGYGWFSLKPDMLAKLEAVEAQERGALEAKVKANEVAAQKAREEEVRKAALPPEVLVAETLIDLPDDQFAAFAKDLASKSEIEQRAFIGLFSTNKEKRKRWKTWKKRRPEIAQAIEAVRVKLNLPPMQ